MLESVRRVNIHAPERAQVSAAKKILWLLGGALLAPVYLVLAGFRKGPGLTFHIKCVLVGAALLINPSARYPRKKAFGIMILPMDSTRYFEFDYVESETRFIKAATYLDVSSPRMVPICIARNHPGLRADLVNPDVADLSETRELIGAIGLESRMSLRASLISEVNFADSSFDLITCISVLEHIPEDSAALRRMWALLRSGGTLILTLPCMAIATEQFVDLDTYKLLDKDRNGYVFWQRFYDRKLLNERVWNVLGRPVKSVIFGEKLAGSFFDNAQKKRRQNCYPFWRESYMMASEYKYFADLESLPGDGVIAMTFVKP